MDATQSQGRVYHVNEEQKTGIVQYLDLQSILDNSSYVPDLVEGELQPLEEIDSDDEFWRTLDVDQIVTNSQRETSDIFPSPENSNKPRCFASPVKESQINTSTKKRSVLYILGFLRFCSQFCYLAWSGPNFFVSKYIK